MLSRLGKHTCARIGAVCAYTCPFLACASFLHVAGCGEDIQHACQAPWGARWPPALSPSPTRVGAWEVWGAYPSTLEGKGACVCGGCRSGKGAPSPPPFCKVPQTCCRAPGPTRNTRGENCGRGRGRRGRGGGGKGGREAGQRPSRALPGTPATSPVQEAPGWGEKTRGVRGRLTSERGRGAAASPSRAAAPPCSGSAPLLSSPLPPRRRRRLLAEGRPRPAPARPAPPPGPSASPPGRAGRCGAVRGRNGLHGRLVNPLLRTGRPGQGDRGCVGSAAAWSTQAPAGLPRPVSRWCLQIPKEEIPQPPMAAWCLGIHAPPRCLNCPLLQTGVFHKRPMICSYTVAEGALRKVRQEGDSHTPPGALL